MLSSDRSLFESSLKHFLGLLTAVVLVALPAAAIAQDGKADEDRRQVGTIFEHAIYADMLEPHPQTIDRIRRTYDQEQFENWIVVQRGRILRQYVFNKLATAFKREHGISVSEAEITDFLATEKKAYADLLASYEENIRVLKDQAEQIVGRGGRVSDEHMQRIVDIEKKMDNLKRQNIDNLMINDKQRILREESDRQRAGEALKAWKFNRLLHEQFGGRVVRQDLTYRPFEAYVAWLQIEEQLGNFEIQDEALRKYFWDYYNQEPADQLEPFEGMWDKLRWQGSGMP